MKSVLLTLLLITTASAFADVNPGSPVISGPGSPVISGPGSPVISGPGSPVISGPENAIVPIDEFADFSCGYCATGSPLMVQLVGEYQPKVNLRFRPIVLPIHPMALTAAQFYHAARMQKPNIGLELEEAMFKAQSDLNTQGEVVLTQIAGDFGLDLKQLHVDMQSTGVSNLIARDQALFKEHGFQGTPSFVIGKDNIQGVRPYEFFKHEIESQLIPTGN